MERAIEFRRLRAPQRDGQTLIEPTWNALPEVVSQNRELLSGFEYDMQGRSIRELSAAARRTLLDLSVAYTSQYRGVPERWQRGIDAQQTPFVLSGHQPEMFHPGVWYKNFVLGGLSRRVEGVGIHLLIDSDMCRTAAARVPTGSIDDPRVAVVCYDKPMIEMPYEERSIQNMIAFSTFAERAIAAIRPLVGDPMVSQLWPLTVERGARQTNLGLRLAMGRHALEESWNNDTLELPQSAVCQMPEFAWFTAHLLAQLPRFRTAHNDALAMYRRAHRLRNRAQPVPDLAAVGDWLEAPFWIWTSEDPERRPLFARAVGNEIEITDRKSHTLRLNLSADGDGAAAAEQIAGLTARGIKLRTRALSTTLFARLVLSDIFLHGIGGAKYDQVMDQIVRLFFGIEPPQFATVSATLRLPIAHDASETVSAGQWDQRLRELRYHPEHHITCDGQRPTSDPCPATAIIAAKRNWVDTPKTRENARERHRAIASANVALQPYVATLREQIECERRDILRHKRNEAILRSREYSFCLYPRQHFDRLLSEPVLV